MAINRSRGAAWLGALAALGSAVPATAAPRTLTRDGPWTMQYDDNDCRMGAKFTDGEWDAHFELSRNTAGHRFEMLLTSARFEPRARFTAGWMPGEHDRPASIFTGTSLPNLHTVQFSSSLVDEELAQSANQVQLRELERTRAAEITHFEVHRGFAQSVVFQTGSMAPPLAALETCIADLYRSWGYDVAALRTFQNMATPRNAPASWVTPDDYPASLVARGVSGRVHIRLDVDAQGRPARCTITRSFTHQTLNDIVCAKIMQRARFEPARDAAGNPAPAPYNTVVNFES